MFFLNLSALEFFGLLGVLGGTITALYFLDRSKRRKVVSTLQFWVSAATASEQRSRKKVNQPWSLLLQLLSLALLLLAIAQLQWGTRPAAGRDHVLLLDTSAWSGAHGDRQGSGATILQTEKELAGRYLAALPAQDRVLLAHTDALTVPATLFTTDREQTRTALKEAATSSSALDLSNALTYAQRAQRGSGGSSGEIVYVGPERVAGDLKSLVLPSNLRVLPVPLSAPNYGIRRVDVRRGETDPNSWRAEVFLMNYGNRSAAVKLRTQFAGTPFNVRSFMLPPQQEVTAEYEFVTNTGGLLTSELEGTDSLSQDNRALLRLPGNRSYDVTAYTKRPELLRPLLTADRRVSATFLDPSHVNDKTKADLVILDTSVAPQQISAPTIWINPSPVASPLPVKTVLPTATIRRWNSSALTAAGLHVREERILQAKSFVTRPTDIVLATVASSTASAEEGPAVVLRVDRSTGKKTAVIGFDPLDNHLRFTVTTPLLFANLLDWMAPDAVRTTELQAARVGSVAVTLDPDESPSHLRVTQANGVALPYTVHEQTLQLFVDRPTTVRISSATRERLLSLILPDVAQTTWSPSASVVASGLPGLAGYGASAFDVWQWLACLGALGLLGEWYLFGRSRGLAKTQRLSTKVAARSESREEELVAP